jgi:hydroxyacylglutathione hydrolase
MTPAEVQARIAAGAVVLDMRPPKPFAAEHLPGAVNIQFNRADLADRAEMAFPKDAPAIVHAEPEPIAKAAVDILQQAGFTVAGHLEGGLKAWKAASMPTESLPLLDVDQLNARLADYDIVDVRERYEYKHGHVPGARLLPWTEAWQRAAADAGDKPLAVICGDQVRSAWAASVLKRAGRPASLVMGGMADWTERGYTVAKGVDPS